MIKRWYRQLSAWWWARKHHNWADYPLAIFRTGHPCGVPLEPYLKRFARPEATLDPKRYRLVLSRGLGREWQWERYRDGLNGFILLASGKAIALVTWNPGDTNEVLYIQQIQGVKGRSDLLRPLRWEKLLIQLVIDWATAHGFRQARIIYAETHEWYNVSRKSSMRLKYEITAKRMGFRPVKDAKYLARDLMPA